jgi:hypothetical protein
MTNINNWFDKLVNRNFFFLNAHGEKLKKLYEIPEGVRIIMFCYSKELQVRKKFDEYNWSHLLLDPTASNNYYDFLTAISGYSSIRDHFYVYEEGDVIHNLDILTDDEFREGLYRLPMKGYVYDNKTDDIVLSDNSLLSEVQKDKNYRKLVRDNKCRSVVVNSKRIVKLLKDKKKVGIIQSQVKKIHDTTRLSNLIGSMKIHASSFTVLLMVCRDCDQEARKVFGVAGDISKGRNILDELERYKGHCDLEKLVRVYH